MKKSVKSRKKRPIKDLLHREGRSLVWLARQTGYTPDHISRVDSGKATGTERFWKLMRSVLGEEVAA